ncbi:MAG: hypothetical protein EHM20_10560 [Alphaproteobacteria bacterium]|nr:MAG: hypothetical protein EHM20_10560 [Alphaproteobacteria bacterium]
MELTYANKEYRKDILAFIKENFENRKDKAFGAKVFTYFISVLKKHGENTEKFEHMKIETVNVRHGIVVFSGKNNMVKLKRYTDKELRDDIRMMRLCQLER